MGLSLESRYYSFEGVVCFGIASEHYKRVSSAASSIESFLHLLIALLETIPLLGWLIAAIECLAANPPPPVVLAPPDAPAGAAPPLSGAPHAAQLPDPPALERDSDLLPPPIPSPDRPLHTSVYTARTWEALAEWTRVTDADTARFVNYNPRGSRTLEEAHAEDVYFYYGNCDAFLKGGAEDIGWGCARRAIQTCLSWRQKQPTFQNLYLRFRLDPTKAQEWAEPGTGRMICNRFGIASKLYLYERVKGSNLTPTGLCETIPGPEAFYNVLFTHFRTHKTPVMIDDGNYASVILGIKKMSTGGYIVWLADTHKDSREEGLYFMGLDGNGVWNNLTGRDVDARGEKNGLATANRVNGKHWPLMLFMAERPALAPKEGDSSKPVLGATLSGQPLDSAQGEIDLESLNRLG